MGYGLQIRSQQKKSVASRNMGYGLQIRSQQNRLNIGYGLQIRSQRGYLCKIYKTTVYHRAEYLPTI